MSGLGSVVPLVVLFVGYQEVLLILVVLVLIFGASRIPELGKGLGEGIKNFKKGMKQGEEDEKKP